VVGAAPASWPAPASTEWQLWPARTTSTEEPCHGGPRARSRRCRGARPQLESGVGVRGRRGQVHRELPRASVEQSRACEADGEASPWSP
jgi:hypothetical protein